MKKYNIKPKYRHKKLANELIKQQVNEGKVNKGKAMRDAGYPISMSKNPKAVLESKGFKATLINAGLTEENIAIMLHEDCVTNAGKRVPELTLVTKLMGLHSEKLNIDVSQNEAVSLLKGILDGEGQKEEED